MNVPYALRVRVRPRREKEPRHGEVRVEAGDPEGRAALGVGGVHVGVVLQIWRV